MTEKEPVEVAAEVIDPEPSRTELDVAFKPGDIAANFDQMHRMVDAILEPYEGWEPSADSVEDVKQCASERKYLNGLAKQVDERRKAVKAEYLKPLNEFEAKANGVRDRIKEAADKLHAVEKEADEYRRTERANALMEHYEGFAGLLAPVVPYERLADPKWLNKSVTLKKAVEELEARVQKVAADWESLKALGLEFHDAAEAQFFRTLDLGEAVAYNAKLAEDRRRIEEMQAAMAPEPEPEPTPEPTPGPASADEWAPQDQEILQQAYAPQPPIQPAPAYEPAPEPSVPMVMVVDACTVSQAKEIGRFCGSIGVTGCFKRGTLREVFRKEFADGRQ